MKFTKSFSMWGKGKKRIYQVHKKNIQMHTLSIMPLKRFSKGSSTDLLREACLYIVWKPSSKSFITSKFSITNCSICFETTKGGAQAAGVIMIPLLPRRYRSKESCCAEYLTISISTLNKTVNRTGWKSSILSRSQVDEIKAMMMMMIKMKF